MAQGWLLERSNPRDLYGGKGGHGHVSVVCLSLKYIVAHSLLGLGRTYFIMISFFCPNDHFFVVAAVEQGSG